MVHTFKGYDPELGKKFAEESGGFVVGIRHLAPRISEAQARHDWIGEHGRQPTDQELFDAMQPLLNSANDATKAPLEERFKQMTPQQLGELFDDLL